MSLPSKGVGHWGITKKQCVNCIPSKVQRRGWVTRGLVFVPETPAIVVVDGIKGPENSGKVEYVAPVSTRKETCLPATRSFTLGS